MGTKQEVEVRRRELCNLKFRGFPLSQVADILSEKYSCSKQTIKHDWYIRKDWISSLYDFDFEDTENVLNDIFAEQKEVKRALWNLYTNGDNDNVKLGAIKAINNANKEYYDMLQNVGIIDKVAEKILISGNLSYENSEDLREQFLQEIMKVSKRMDENEELKNIEKNKVKNKDIAGGDDN